MQQIIGALSEWDTDKIADWSFAVFSEQLRTVQMSESSRYFVNNGIRHCRLGQCKDFPLLLRYADDASMLERIIQGMAFEICSIIEPNWNAIISKTWEE